MVIRAEHYRGARKSSWKHDKALMYPRLTALLLDLLRHSCPGLPSCKCCRIITAFSIFKGKIEAKSKTMINLTDLKLYQIPGQCKSQSSCLPGVL